MFVLVHNAVSAVSASHSIHFRARTDEVLSHVCGVCWLRVPCLTLICLFERPVMLIFADHDIIVVCDRASAIVLRPSLVIFANQLIIASLAASSWIRRLLSSVVFHVKRLGRRGLLAPLPILVASCFTVLSGRVMACIRALLGCLGRLVFIRCLRLILAV